MHAFSCADPVNDAVVCLTVSSFQGYEIKQQGETALLTQNKTTVSENGKVAREIGISLIAQIVWHEQNSNQHAWGEEGKEMQSFSFDAVV